MQKNSWNLFITKNQIVFGKNRFHEFFCTFFTDFRAQYEGHLTNKNQLPVTKINFGGLGQSSLRPREAKFELGPLYCSGADPGDQNYAVRNHGASPASCKDLWLRGHQDVSFIRINNHSTIYKSEVNFFCYIDLFL